ncbi:MAG: PSD1 and planctomycete cytochrome C domain-containing protein [Planctomycetes bacterium]|nr:PSD1 and planctomycete cytochrome C domain-containing protein [Planctomycetota bacterium]
MRFFLSVFLGSLLLAPPVFAVEGEATEGERLFALQVKPLLAEKCLICHGADPDEIQGALDLTTREGMLRGGESGQVLLQPGDAAASLLYTATTGDNPDYQMPPKENDRLSEEQTWRLRDWINAGAPWPDETRVAAIQKSFAEQESAGVQVRTSGGLSEEWTSRRYQPENLWAYQPLVKPEVPWEYVGGDQGANPIDAFLNRRLEELDLEPAPRANRRTWIRRATFDLTGLPPTPQEVAEFVNDPAPEGEAFAAVVERLLDSPHYGEQWGRHWLDVVRYADTAGLANDFERPNAWRYRDYVIRSFNEDKPYDQFVREQLAGDEIDPEDPEMLIAIGFLRMGPWEQTGMSVAKVTRQQFLDDVTDAVGQVFLSHPLQCCRCHDHKFDPIPTRDYYALQAVFATTQFAERDAPYLPEENTAGFAAEEKYLQQRIEHYNGILRRIAKKEEDAARAWYAERGLEYAPRRELIKRGLPEDKIAPRHIGLTTEDFGVERIARKSLARHRWELDRFRPIAFSVYNGVTPNYRNVQSRLEMPADPMKSGSLEKTAILAGGDAFSPTLPVSPGVLSCVAEEGFTIPDSIAGRRRDLAEWIASPDNPLTARSLVNRVWQYHFGQGLARNANNFGAMGKKPTHPELLDYLAARFIEEGWSIKSLHRLIMASEAYQRSSQHSDRAALAEKDPEGAAYAYFPPRRLTAEELRDAMLAASGELNRTLGGLPIRPDMNLEAALQPRQIMGTYAPAYQPSPLPEQRNRRSIYAMRIRGLADPFMEVFNQPSPDESCELRDSSTVTPQTFALFNSEETYDRSLAMASRLLKETETDEAAVCRAFALTFGRPSSDEERDSCLEHWRAMTARHEQLEFEPQSPPMEVVRHAVEEMNGEPFTFVEKLEVYQDYVPDLKPWNADPRTRGLAEVCLVLFNANEFIYVP